jgi:hypothetical protein
MQVKFHNEEYPEGLEFDVGGLLLPNKQVVVITEEEKEYLEGVHGEPLKEYLSKNPHMIVDGVAYVPPPQEETQFVIVEDESNDEEEGDN